MSEGMNGALPNRAGNSLTLFSPKAFSVAPVRFDRVRPFSQRRSAHITMAVQVAPGNAAVRRAAADLLLREPRQVARGDVATLNAEATKRAASSALFTELAAIVTVTSASDCRCASDSPGASPSKEGQCCWNGCSMYEGSSRLLPQRAVAAVAISRAGWEAADGTSSPATAMVTTPS
jgi:hypothetical protein